MSQLHRFAYVHGFTSSPRSGKGQEISRAFADRGLELALPDLNRPSLARLSHAAMLAALDDMDQPGPAWRLIGSSLGGWLAARWAELHPERVDRLVLLCPGFDMAARWPDLVGRERMAHWERTGWLAWPDPSGALVGVHWAFIEEGFQQPPAPEAPCPTVIIHGTRDQSVPISSSRRYAAPRDHVRLVEVDDDHSLAASIPLIINEVLNAFDISDAHPRASQNKSGQELS